LTFDSYDELVTDRERDYYLTARMAAIRDAHAAEFIARSRVTG
jgi:hypothetical protein